MITRRQAKLQRLTAAVESSAPTPDPTPPAVTANALCDASLELVFSYLDPDDVVRASQVCRRWSDICSSRRVWASRTLLSVFSNDNLPHFYRVVRVLRRTRGVFPFSKVSIWTGFSGSRVFFKENGDRLVIDTSSSLLVLLSLRYLVKDNVTKLEFVEKAFLFSPAEALVLWETIASKTQLECLTICLLRNSALLGTLFQWPTRGSMTHLEFSCTNSVRATRLCHPIRSLLQLHQDQMIRVYVRPEDQQALLKFRATRLRNLQAVLLPDILDTFKSVSNLSTLFLHADSRSPALSFRVLHGVLSFRTLHRSVTQLEITFPVGVSTPESEQLLRDLASFRNLVWVRLCGIVSALADPDLGQAAFESLLSGMPFARKLVLDVEPSSLLLQVLLPRTTADGSKERRVSDRLRLLMLGNAKTSLTQAFDSKWLQLVRRIMDESPNLHILVEGKSPQAEHNPLNRCRKLLSNTLILPHPADGYCQDCPGAKITKKRGYRSTYIGDLCQD